MTGGSAKSRSSSRARSRTGSGARSACRARCCTSCTRLWRARDEADEYFGTLVNAWLADGGEAVAVPAGTAYVDVGTLGGYREAMRLLAEAAHSPERTARVAPLPLRAGRR